MAVAAVIPGSYLPAKSCHLPLKITNQAAGILSPPPPLHISTNPADVNPHHLQNLYALCNHSCHRFPKFDSNGRVEPVDISKLRIALSHSSVVVSVFTRPEFTSHSSSTTTEASKSVGIGGEWIQRVMPVTPSNGQLVGFGRAVSDLGLTASIYDVMVRKKSFLVLEMKRGFSLITQSNYWTGHSWRETRTIYIYSTGNKQHLYVNNPELVKEMNQSVSLGLGKPSYITKRLAPMLGNGILRSNGHIWAQQRKIVAPEFYIDKVKGMVGLMLQSVEPLTTKWDAAIEEQGGTMAEIDVEEALRGVSGDVISRACFGSSYFEGKKIFSKLRTLQKIIANQSVIFGISTSGFLPSKRQKEIQSLEKEIESLIWETVRQRKEECLEPPSSGKDLLQQILEGAVNDVGKDSSKNFIVDNCKNIYFAGHESTAVAASWCLMLLALHPEWQNRIREEMVQVCPNGVPDAESLYKMKMVTMVIHEVLRLYPPAAFVSREALEDAQIGHIVVPKGVCTWVLIPTLHRDPEIWGADANEFKPERFANGILGACKLPQVYIPFGLGPRLCLGRNFALVQLKVVISLIVSKFSFSLSPKYRHSPAYRMIVEPGQGVQILIKRCGQA